MIWAEMIYNRNILPIYALEMLPQYDSDVTTRPIWVCVILML